MNNVAGDEELALEFAHGRTEAFRQLYERHRQAVYSMAARYLGNRNGAEDVAHDAFLTVYEKIAQFDPGRGSFRAWLFTIAYHRCCRARRRGSRPIALDSMPGQSGIVRDKATPEDKLDLKRMLAGLPEPLRAAVLLTKLHGFSVADCAVILGISETNVKQRVFRGVKAMREISRKGEADGWGQRKCRLP